MPVQNVKVLTRNFCVCRNIPTTVCSNIAYSNLSNKVPTPTFSSPLAKKNKKILRNELERKGGQKCFYNKNNVAARKEAEGTEVSSGGAIILCRPVGDSEEKHDEGEVESASSTANNKLVVSRDVVNI